MQSYAITLEVTIATTIDVYADSAQEAAESLKWLYAQQGDAALVKFAHPQGIAYDRIHGHCDEVKIVSVMDEDENELEQTVESF